MAVADFLVTFERVHCVGNNRNAVIESTKMTFKNRVDESVHETFKIRKFC